MLFRSKFAGVYQKGVNMRMQASLLASAALTAEVDTLKVFLTFIVLELLLGTPELLLGPLEVLL